MREGKPVEHVTANRITYQGSGLRVTLPDQKAMTFKKIDRLAYDGRPFVLFADLGDEVGCEYHFLVYDEDGDGKFEHVLINERPLFHIPEWAKLPAHGKEQ